MPKLTSMILLLALHSSASAAPPTPVAPPTSAEPAPQTSKGLDLSPATPEAVPSPFHKRWPFWTAVGVAVGAAVVVGVGLLARSSNDMNLGNPTFGTKDY